MMNVHHLCENCRVKLRINVVHNLYTLFNLLPHVSLIVLKYIWKISIKGKEVKEEDPRIEEEELRLE